MHNSKKYLIAQYCAIARNFQLHSIANSQKYSIAQDCPFFKLVYIKIQRVKNWTLFHFNKNWILRIQTHWSQEFLHCRSLNNCIKQFLIIIHSKPFYYTNVSHTTYYSILLSISPSSTLQTITRKHFPLLSRNFVEMFISIDISSTSIL